MKTGGTCSNGDVQLTTNGGAPEYFLDGEWYPICGHYFWNNNHGATALCQKLGYTSGTVQKTRTAYAKNAVKVGACRAGEAIDSCSAGCNERNANSGGCANCQAGQGVGVTVTCSGGTGSTSSCGSGSTGGSGTRAHLCPLLVSSCGFI